jgi:hypothetical protein
MIMIIIVSKMTEGRYAESITYCILPVQHRSHGPELDCGMPTADSLSTCNINVCDSSAVAAVASIPRTNSLYLTMPALCAVRSGWSPVGATHETKCYWIPSVQLSSPAELRQSVTNNLWKEGRKIKYICTKYGHFTWEANMKLCV